MPLPIPGFGGGVPNPGSLQQAVTTAQNELARLESLLGPNALSVIKQRGIVKAAIDALRAATGSQQGIGGGGPTIGTGAFIPNPASFLTPQFSAQHPELANILNAPSPLDQIIGSIGFGSNQNQVQRWLPQPVWQQAQPTQERAFNIRDLEQSPVPFSPAGLDQYLASERGTLASKSPAPTTPGGRPFFPMGAGIASTATKPVQTKSIPKRRPTRTRTAPGRRI